MHAGMLPSSGCRPRRERTQSSIKRMWMIAALWLQQVVIAVLGQQSHSPAMLNVRDFGAKGDGTTDDTAAIQAAIDVLGYQDVAQGSEGPGILVFPSGTYCVSRTLNTSSQGNHLMGSGWGPNSDQNNPWYPVLSWKGPPGGTLFSVLDFHSGFRFENFYLQGNKQAGTLLHVHVRVHPTGSTHDPEITNVYFRGYCEYGLILGEASEDELGAGELSDVVCKHLTFNNNVFNATGLLVNAQNMEVGTFYTMRFDNDAQGCAHPNNPCGDECCHRNHIFHRAGRASIFSLTTTRAWDYAIHAWDTVNVHGWDSEDPLLYTGRAVPFCCPASITGLLHRGEYRPHALLWAAEPSLTVSDAVMSGDITIAPSPSAVVTSNIQFRGNATLAIETPSQAAHIDLSPNDGRITVRAPDPELELRDSLGHATLRAVNRSLVVPGSMTASSLICSGGLEKDLCHSADTTGAEWRAVQAEAEAKTLRAELATLASRMRSIEERLQSAGL